MVWWRLVGTFRMWGLWCRVSGAELGGRTLAGLVLCGGAASALRTIERSSLRAKIFQLTQLPPTAGASSQMSTLGEGLRIRKWYSMCTFQKVDSGKIFRLAVQLFRCAAHELCGCVTHVHSIKAPLHQSHHWCTLASCLVEK